MLNTKIKLQKVGFPVTNRCNLQCVMCQRQSLIGNKLLDPGVDLSIDKLNLFLKSIGHKKVQVNLSSGYGEPMLNEDLAKIIKIIKRKGHEVILFTNATVDDVKLIRAVMDSRPNMVIISMDYGEKAKYETIRRGAIFEQVLENINLLVNNNHAKTRIAISKVFLKGDRVNDLTNIIKVASTLMVKKIEIKDCYPVLAGRGYWREIKAAEQKDINDFARNLNVVISFPKKHSGGSLFRCPDLYDSLYWDINGRVRYCCFNYDMNSPFCVEGENVDDIQNSNEFNAARELFTKGKPPQKCFLCPIREDC